MHPIRLSSGMASFKVHERVREAAIRAIQSDLPPSIPTEGLSDLREAIADRYRECNQTTVPPEQILVTPGTSQAVYNALACLLRPGDEVILPAPHWFAFPGMIRQAGGQPVLLPTYLEQQFDLNPKKLESLISPRTRLFLFCNPHNPTGRIYSRAEMEGIVRVLQNHPQVYVLSDEIYDFVTYGERVPSWLELESFRDRLFLVNGFSKSFALTAWRVGYLIPPPFFWQPCLQYQAVTLGGTSPYVQEAATAALRHRALIHPSMLDTLTLHRKIMAEALDALPVPHYAPEGAYYFFADFSAVIRQRHPEWIAEAGSAFFFEQLCTEAGLDILAGDTSGAPGFGRISFAVETSHLLTAIERLRRFCLKK